MRPDLNIETFNFAVRWKEACYLITPGETKIDEFAHVLEFAYHKLAGSADA